MSASRRNGGGAGPARDPRPGRGKAAGAWAGAAAGGVRIVADDARAGEAAADGVLHALGAPPERRQAAPLAGAAGLGQGDAGAAETAAQRVTGGRVGQRDRARLAPEDRAALVTAERRGQAAHR